MVRNPAIALAGLILITLSGCLPIELSVSPDGRVLIPRQEGFVLLDSGSGKVTIAYAPQDQQPTFGKFSPDGKQFLAFAGGGQSGFGGMGFAAALVDAATGNARNVGSFSNVTYAQWSRDGKRISLTRLSDQQTPPLEQNMPELLVLDPATGASRQVSPNVSVLHRWLPDSKHVLIFQINKKLEDGSNYHGTLVQLNVDDGSRTALAEVIGGQEMFLDLSPDGSKALFVALQAGPAGQVPVPAENAPKTLFELAVAAKTLRPVRQNVEYAIYSPKGVSVLLGAEGEEGSQKGLELLVADAALDKPRTVAKDAEHQVGSGFGPSTPIYPVWRDDQTLLYLASRAVYGTAGKNLELVSIKTDGTARASLQAMVDNAVAK